MFKKILNILFFQAAWWGLVLANAADKELLGYRIAGIYLIYHFFAEVPRGAKIKELFFILLVGIAGFSLDGVYHWLGYIQFADASFAPGWLLALWFCFACTIRYGLNGLLENPRAAVLLGAIFGPLSYAAGESFHLLVFPMPSWHGYLLYALTWGALMLLFSHLNSARQHTRR